MEKSGKKLFTSVKVLCAAGLLAGVAVVVAYICKAFTLTLYLRITFENLPIILCGYLFGPLTGAICGAVSDVVNTALSQYGFGGMNPLITLGSAVTGFAAGAVSRWIFRREDDRSLLWAVAAAHFFGNILVKSAAMMIWWSAPIPALLPRIPLYILIAAVEFILLRILLGNKGIQKAIGGIRS